MEQDPGAIADPGDHSGINTVADPPVEYLPEAIDGLSDTYTPPSPVAEDREIAVADADSLGFSTEFEPPLESLDDYSADSAEQRPSSEVPRDAIDDNPQAQNYTIDKKTGKIFPADKVDLPDKERSSYELNKLSTDQLQAISSLKDGEADPIEVKLLFKTTVLPNGGVEEQYSVQIYKPTGHDEHGRVQFEIGSNLLTIVKDPEESEEETAEDGAAGKTKDKDTQEPEESSAEPLDPSAKLQPDAPRAKTSTDQPSQPLPTDDQKPPERRASSAIPSATTVGDSRAKFTDTANQSLAHKETGDTDSERRPVQPATASEVTEDNNQQPRRPAGVSPIKPDMGGGGGRADLIKPTDQSSHQPTTPPELPKSAPDQSARRAIAPVEQQQTKSAASADIVGPVLEQKNNNHPPTYAAYFEKDDNPPAPALTTTESSAASNQNATNNNASEATAPVAATKETTAISSTPINRLVDPLEAVQTVDGTKNTATTPSLGDLTVNTATDIAPKATQETLTTRMTTDVVSPPKTVPAEVVRVTETVNTHPSSVRETILDYTKPLTAPSNTATAIPETPPVNHEQTISPQPNYHDLNSVQPTTENLSTQAELGSTTSVQVATENLSTQTEPNRTPPVQVAEENLSIQAELGSTTSVQVAKERPTATHAQPNHPYLNSPGKEGLSRFLFPLPTQVATDSNDITLSFTTQQRRKRQIPNRLETLAAGVTV